MAERPRLFGRGSPGAPRVRVFHEIRYSAADPGSLTAGLRPLMKGLDRTAAVAVWGLRSSHQALLLPAASSVDVETLARHEAGRAPDGPPPGLLADAIVTGALRDGQREVGCVSVPAEELQSRLRPLVDAGFTVASAVTPAQAHASLLRQRRAHLSDAVVAVLSVNAHVTALSIIHQNVVLFAREFPWGVETRRPDDDGARPGGAAFTVRIAPEVRRSLAHVQESSRADVSRVVICGDMPDIRTLTGPLMDELAVDVETLDVSDDVDLSRLTAPSDGFQSRLGAWRTALALAVDPATLPALRPQETAPPRAGTRIALRTAAAAGAGVLLTAAGWGLLGYLSADAAARQVRLRWMISTLEPELQRENDARRQAAVDAAGDSAMRAFASQGPRLARVLEAFGHAAPPNLALSAVRVEPAAAAWRITAEGRVEGADAVSAQATVNGFLKALDASPLLGRPVAPPSLHVRSSGADVSGRRPWEPADTASVIDFSVQYEVAK